MIGGKSSKCLPYWGVFIIYAQGAVDVRGGGSKICRCQLREVWVTFVDAHSGLGYTFVNSESFFASIILGAPLEINILLYGSTLVK